MSKNPIITLTSDLGLSDFYVAAVKGAILKILPTAQIIDICHDVPKFNTLHAAYNIRNAFKQFPDGTVHIISVNSIEDEQTAHVALRKYNQFFIGADTGIFSLVFDEPADEIIQLSANEKKTSIFPLLESFIEPACNLATGKKLSSLGRKIDGFRKMLMPAPTINAHLIVGSIIYQDSFGNLITNIRRKHFEEIGKGLPFTIDLRSSRNSLHTIHKSYKDVGEGDPVAIFNYSGYLEIALNQASAVRLLGLKINDSIRIEFHAD
ncbi:MAG: SAM-dependent chlorinase/fluorinase [Bacteroidia bacterium]|nr:SAM-dependent chlorinase/fluorinase [Bacteroidia bacterium]MCC6768744.1 SAM-dependent chlorinase/fluorinase [Bacteroidia bacterium]